MPNRILCKICGKRRARRACPAVQGDICSICCGTEREVSLSCPLECIYLQEAHRYEKPVLVVEAEIAHREIKVSEEFVREHEELVLFCAFALVRAALKTEGAIDADVLAALDALIQTQRTLQSGLVYETRANNTIAMAIQRSFSESLSEYEKVRAERGGFSSTRSSDILSTLVFLHRMGLANQNGRPRGRMYLDFLRQMTPEPGAVERAASIIL